SQISSHRRGGSAENVSVAGTSSMNRFRQRILAALAQPRPGRIAGHGRDIPPAALALDPAGALDGDPGRSRFPRTGLGLVERDVRDDEQHRKLLLVLLQELE